MSNTKSKAYFWLANSGVGARITNALLGVYEPEELLENFHSIEVLKKSLKKASYEKLSKTASIDKIDAELSDIRKKEVSVVTLATDKFPEKLRQSEVNPPAALFCKGDVSLMQNTCIAVVGTRKCTDYGIKAVRKIVPALCSAGVTVVTGLASGIDCYAAEAALNAGGKVIGVLGMGHDKFAPNDAKKTYARVLAEGGLVVSEYPPTRPGEKYTFPERNRIISGLSEGVLIVEAPEGSGSLITANFAAEQGRQVYAVPGNIDGLRSSGVNRLIKEGAGLVTDGSEILADLGLDSVKNPEKKPVPTLDNDKKIIYTVLQSGKMHFDKMCVELKIPSFELSRRLTEMELAGIIEKLPANYYCLKTV